MLHGCGIIKSCLKYHEEKVFPVQFRKYSIFSPILLHILRKVVSFLLCGVFLVEKCWYVNQFVGPNSARSSILYMIKPIKEQSEAPRFIYLEVRLFLQIWHHRVKGIRIKSQGLLVPLNHWRHYCANLFWVLLQHIETTFACPQAHTRGRRPSFCCRSTRSEALWRFLSTSSK